MKKTNSYITPKNLENILKLFLKAQEKKNPRKKEKIINQKNIYMSNIEMSNREIF